MKKLAALVVCLAFHVHYGFADEAVDSRSDAAVAAIEKLGGKVERDATRPGRPVVKVHLNRTECNDADLARLTAFPELRELHCQGFCKAPNKNHITDAGLKHLRSLLQLEALNVSWHQGVTDQGLVHLQAIPNLKSVDLSITRVTNEGAANLMKLRPGLQADR